LAGKPGLSELQVELRLVASPLEMAAVRVATPEIRWHCGPTGLNEAVLSLDFLPAGGAGGQDDDEKQRQVAVLATGGADKEIKLWRVSGAVTDDRREAVKAADKGEQGEGSETADMEEGKGDKGVRGLEFVFSLSGHDRSVNCVRFSPNGAFLASASDDTSIILWSKPKSADASWRWDAISSLSDVARTILACGHKGDITDLAWSPDSAFLCSTSVDNRCVIWNVDKGDVVERRKDHTQYVQGVAWDPLNEFLVTEGNDRTCRVYALGSSATGKKQTRKLSCVQTLKTREFPPSGGAAVSSAAKTSNGSASTDKEAEGTATQPPPPPAKHRMFLDDTCPAFARRPAWTPDGNYLLAPTGTFRATASTSKSAAVHTVYAFARGDLSRPTLHLPGHDKASLAVRCSPFLYELRHDGQPENGDSKGGVENSSESAANPVVNFFQTPYRSVFAVVTLNAVVLYDTQVRFFDWPGYRSPLTFLRYAAQQQVHPICTLKDLHYADLTDASWSADGQMLSVSSMDGYLSFIQFAPGFFGARVSPQSKSCLSWRSELALCHLTHLA
jgi:chromatin assembly factor 1 subunit B